MFKDDYTNQIENIKPDNYIKNKVREKLTEEEAPKKRRILYPSLVAAALCCIIIASTAVLGGRKNPPLIDPPDNENISVPSGVKDYSRLYDTLKQFITTDSDDLAEIEDTEANFNTGLKTEAAPGAGVAGDTATNSTTTSNKHSQTTTQVEGVDEADIVKTDGEFIYILSSAFNTVKIVDAREKEPKQLSSIEVDSISYSINMFLSGDRLIVIGEVHESNSALAVIYNISNPEKPKEIGKCEQSGSHLETRLIGGKLYMLSNYRVLVSEIEKGETASYVPTINCADYDDTVKPDCINIYKNCSSPVYTVMVSYDIKDASLVSSQSLLGGSYIVYVSTNNIITTGNTYSDKTQVARFSIKDGIITFLATTELDGSPLNQFSIDEYKNHFRFVLTVNKGIEKEENGISSFTFENSNSVVILDENLNKTGEITNIAKHERVYSVRFMGDIAYFVTFRQTDPLFSADLSDPKNPKIIGALKIPGFSNYLFPFGDKLLGIGMNADEETGRTDYMKLSLFDIKDPTNVTESYKTIVPIKYSDALSNHKAIIVDYEKNIIGFGGYGLNGKEYYIYSFENGEFVIKEKAVFPIADYKIPTLRGLYINDIFYIVSENLIQYYSLTDFSPLGKLTLK